MSDRYEEIQGWVQVSFPSLVTAVSELTYDEIVELVKRVDADQGDSMFTDMLKKAASTEERQWGYRVTDTWTEEDGSPKSFMYEHMVGAGPSNEAFARRKVEWLNENASGQAQVVFRTLVIGDWQVVSDG